MMDKCKDDPDFLREKIALLKDEIKALKRQLAQKKREERRDRQPL